MRQFDGTSKLLPKTTDMKRITSAAEPFQNQTRAVKPSSTNRNEFVLSRGSEVIVSNGAYGNRNLMFFILELLSGFVKSTKVGKKEESL